MEFGIDFDYASECWRQNKKRKKNGYFVYICNYIRSNGNRCRRTIYSNIIHNEYKNTYNNYEYHDKYNKHPNRHIFCKRHLNRCCIFIDNL